MKFGVMVATKIDDWQLLQYAGSLGYDHGWVPDSQDEIIDKIRERERRVLREITLLPPRASARKVFKDFAEQVIARY